MLVKNSFVQISVSTFLTIIALLCFGSCKQTVDPQSVAFTFDSLTYQIHKTVPAIEGQEKPCLEVNISLQSAQTGACPELVDMVNEFIAVHLFNYGARYGTLSSMIDNVISVHEQQYRDYVNEGLQNYNGDLAAAEHWLSGDFSLEGRPVYNQHGILTYAYSLYEYNGGPHGTTSFTFRTCILDRVEGDDPYVCDIVSLNDLFNGDSLILIDRMFEQRMAEKFGKTSIDELRQQGPLFENAEIMPTDNFFFDNQTVTFLYNVYELAPYAAGPIELTFTWEELRPFMPADSPFHRIMKLEN